MKVVYFGTSDIGLPILLKLHKEHTIVGVVTAPDKPVGRKQILTASPIAELAQQLHLPVLKPEKVKTNTELLSQLRELHADIFIVVSYGKILPVDLLTIPPLKTINVHFSLLPKYRGAAPVQFALLNGETTTGTTIFILDEALDHGPILAQKSLAIDPDDTNISLQMKLAGLSSDLLATCLRNYEAGAITPKEQNHSEATATRIITKEDGMIDWHKSSQHIYNQFRAYQPWPGIYTTYKDKKLKIISCRPGSQSNLLPGHVSTTMIGCGNNTSLEIISVQPEGKSVMSIKDFLNGYPDFAATSLT